MNKIQIVYITFDGILEPLGESQVLRLVEAITLASSVEFTVLSLEKSSTLSNPQVVEAVARRFERLGVVWKHRVYRHGVRGIIQNLMTMLGLLGESTDSSIGILHARSYLAAFVANSISSVSEVPVLFDFRGYWVDERIEEGQWFTNRLGLAIGRLVERRLFEGADGIVSLTETGIQDIKSGGFGEVTAKHMVVIPTCVDEHLFSIQNRQAPRPDLLAGKTVIGWVGSLNASYLIEESLTLVANIQAKNPDTFFLGLTGQTEFLAHYCDTLGIPSDRRLILSVSPQDVPKWMGWMDFGLLLLKENVAKRGSMPTKLGEFLASGVQPIYKGGNEDMKRWIERAGTGIRAEELKKDPILPRRSVNELQFAWERVRLHFSLEAGVDRYLAIYESLTRSKA